MTYFRTGAFLFVLTVSLLPGTAVLSSPIFLQQSGDGDPSSAAAPLAMSEVHRKFIWDIEQQWRSSTHCRETIEWETAG